MKNFSKKELTDLKNSSKLLHSNLDKASEWVSRNLKFEERIVEGNKLKPMFNSYNGKTEPYNMGRQYLPKAYLHNGYIDILKPELIKKNMISGENIYPYVMNKNDTIEKITETCNKNELVIMLDFGSKRIYTKLDSTLIKDYLATYPVPDLLPLKTNDSLGGLHCEKFQAVYQKLEDGYDCEIYTTDEIDIKGSNWCNPFSELPGVMMEYEVSQYGLVTRMKADSLSRETISNDVFVIPGDFKEVSLEQMLFQMEEIFKQIIE